MINMTYEVGVLCWASTIVFWMAVVVIAVGVIRVLFRKK
jgi:hypothetical protein